MAAGVFATGKSFRVALLTPTSVACADSVTATSSSYGVLNSSSVVGFGLSFFSRANIVSISAADKRLARRARLAAGSSSLRWASWLVALRGLGARTCERGGGGRGQGGGGRAGRSVGCRLGFALFGAFARATFQSCVACAVAFARGERGEACIACIVQRLAAVIAHTTCTRRHGRAGPASIARSTSSTRNAALIAWAAVPRGSRQPHAQASDASCITGR